jgi:hypothetical protein
MTYLESLLIKEEDRKKEEPETPVMPPRKLTPAQMAEASREETFRQIQALGEIVGTERAFGILTTYKVDKLIAAEESLDKLGFPSTPSEGQERVENLMDYVKLIEENPWLNDNSNHFATSVPELKEVTALLKEINPEALYNITRDLSSKASGFLKNYGLEPEEGVDTTALFRGIVTEYDDGTQVKKVKFLPETTKKEFLETILDENVPPSFTIPKGFDNWQIAVRYLFLEDKRENEKPDDGDHIPFHTGAQHYVELGLTSLEAIETFNQLDVSRVVWVFGETAQEYVQGDFDKFRELSEKAQLKNSALYFSALGNLRYFDTVMAMEDKPSFNSIVFTKKNFLPEGNLDQVLTLAKEIDSPEAEMLFYEDGTLAEFAGTPEDFKAQVEKYTAVKNKWVEATGKDYFNPENVEFVETYSGDLRFFQDFDFMGDGSYSKRVDQLQEAMTFIEYIALGNALQNDESVTHTTESRTRSRIIPKLVELGYSKEEIREIAERTENVQDLYSNVGDIRDKTSVDILCLALNQRLKIKTVNQYSPFLGEDQLPVSMLPALESHKVNRHNLGQFLDAVEVTDYWSLVKGEKKFDAIGFLTDYKLFHNIADPVEKK